MIKHAMMAALLLSLSTPTLAGVDRDIRKHCENQWPGDSKMKRYCAKKQRNYYDWARSIEKKNHPSRPIRQKLQACKDRYGSDFEMVNICFNNS